MTPVTSDRVTDETNAYERSASDSSALSTARAELPHGKAHRRVPSRHPFWRAGLGVHLHAFHRKTSPEQSHLKTASIMLVHDLT